MYNVQHNISITPWIEDRSLKHYHRANLHGITVVSESCLVLSVNTKSNYKAILVRTVSESNRMSMRLCTSLTGIL